MKERVTEGVLQTFVNDLNCTGDETNIFDCPHNGIEGYSCGTYEDAYVVCNSKYCK